jgi:putative ABC transport system permease protein
MRTERVVVASEHFASKNALSIGDQFSLRTPEGSIAFELGAIVVDYSGDLGTVFVARSTFERYWHDRAINAYQIWLEPGVSVATAREHLAGALSGVCDCLVLSSLQYNARGAEFVDSIFYSAYAIEGVAAVVLLVSITSFFTITLAERRREIALLRIVGATRPQLHAIFLGEALLIALLGGALGCGIGGLLAKRIVQGAVRIGGGMVLPFRLPFEAVAVTLGVVVVVALLAAVAPIAGATRLLRADGPNKDVDA